MNLNKLFFLYSNVLIIMCGCSSNKQETFPANVPDEKKVKEIIITLEEAALKEWSRGNPDGFIGLSANDVVYIDPFFKQKMEGIEKLKEYYNSLRGKVKIDKYEIIRPVVQITSQAAILTYNFVSQMGKETHKWNCTEVYRLEPNGHWKIIHTHWSFVQPLE